MIELSPYDFDDRLFFIGAALVANAVLGAYAIRKALRLQVPGNFLRYQLRSLERQLNRSHRSPKERAIRGTIVLLATLLLTGFVAASLSALTATRHVGHLGFIGEIALLAFFLPQRFLYDETKRIYGLLKTRNLAEARKAVAHFTLQDTHNLDDHSLIRASAEYLASGFSDRVLSPILWYVLLGLPGFLASRIITETAHLLGYASRRHKAYGKTPGNLDKVINAVPARLAGYLLAFAACFVPKAYPLRAWKTMRRAASSIHPPRKGQPIAAAAGALSLSLAGPRSVQGFLVQDDWIGNGTAKATLQDFKKMLLLYAIGCLLNLAVIATLLVLLAQ